jgi:GTP cyclohydrolase I
MLLRKPVMFCMMMRGVEKQNARTTTAEYLGEYREQASPRAEFLQSVGATGGELWRK